jgi:hypothetical protein
MTPFARPLVVLSVFPVVLRFHPPTDRGVRRSVTSCAAFAIPRSHIRPHSFGSVLRGPALLLVLRELPPGG